MPDSLFLTHAAADRDFALRLANFLNFGCDVACVVDEAAIAPSQNIIVKAEEGTWASVLVLILSKDSWPARIAREQWEPLLLDPDLTILSIQLSDCACPDLLRRKNFFNAEDRHAMRRIKRWLWQRKHAPGEPPPDRFSIDLEDVYAAISDRAGTLEIAGGLAERFADEAEREFEAVFWIPCSGRTLAQASGELGRQLGLQLDGPLAENCRTIRNVLEPRRCLLVLDAPDEKIKAALSINGRPSTLITTEPVKHIQTPVTFEYGRHLVRTGCLAEAYALFYELLDAVVSPDDCARELAWICDHWGRVEEAQRLRQQCGSPPRSQLSLFD